jgi:PAS domain-containing protein
MLGFEDMSTRKKLTIAGVGVLLLAAGLGWAFKPLSEEKKIERMVEKLAKVENPRDGFRELREAVEKGQLTEEQAMQAGMAAMDRRMDEYFALAEGKPRQEYLDRLIDQFESQRREWEQRAATRPSEGRNRRGDGPTTRPGGWGRGDAAQRMLRQQSVPPERMARMMKFMQDMAARRAERGLPAMGGGMRGMGGFGGGFGGPRGGNNPGGSGNNR